MITTDTRRGEVDEENARHAKDLKLKNEELDAAADHLRMLTADLDDQKERLRAVLTMSPEEILIFSRDLRISYLNPPAAAALHMKKADEAIDATLGEPGIRVEQVLPSLEEVIWVFTEGTVVRGQYSRRENDTIQHLAYIMSPTTTGPGDSRQPS
ncbi:hypothetical protein [Methanosphaerula palustris]|uniref:PAS/PAC sensor protein n=1 Tax=Methanosphaerula palustris (strain ATCC BAA-1556 / DSM 19958 / E1-9c) TaxID=521011 RepID=B8GE66_METPE|nr:hypothetical protein [Methanosphaerula palustris]ACL17567.1 hypothetical protein Mpal_2279 [Methanosphaerula palustris E1-9c]